MKKSSSKGSSRKKRNIELQPITELEDIELIKQNLADNPRDYCLFVLGINTNLKVSDLIQLRARDVRYLAVGDTLEIPETKSMRTRKTTLNRPAIEALQQLLSSRLYEDSTPLFISQTGNKKLTKERVNRLVKEWCKKINLKGTFGGETLRKTFGYMQRKQRKTSISQLMRMFNHSNWKQTLEYLCIQDEEDKKAFLELEL